jgi:hypothetical protein
MAPWDERSGPAKAGPHEFVHDPCGAYFDHGHLDKSLRDVSLIETCMCLVCGFLPA